MATGLEIVPIALAVYPVLILLLDEYKSGARYYTKFVRFRERYYNFVSETDAQQLLLQNVLQDLLCCGPDPFFVQIDSKDMFLEKLKDSAFSWNDPNLAKSLKIRLDVNGYQVCIKYVQRILKMMQGLKDVIGTSVVWTLSAFSNLS